MRIFRFILLPLLLLTPAISALGTPNRIVSLSPATTEMLFALGLGPKVVGDTIFCDYPPAAKSIAKIGDATTNYERVIALHPDLVVADSSANASALVQLKRLPVKVLAVSMLDYLQTEGAIETIAKATDSLDQAKVVIKKMESQRMQAAALASRDHGPAPRVLVVVSTDPLWSAGAHTFVGDLISRAGGVNVAAALRNYAPYSREAALAAQPNVVLVGSYDRAAFLNDPAMRALPAVKLGHIYVLADENTVMRPGPRLGDGLLTIARLLHPGSK